jgi:hypothetical protein
MKTVRNALIFLACSVPLLASAQWQWTDNSGRRVFSDKAPPSDIAPDRILKVPRGAVMPAAQAETTAAVPASVAKPSGKDPALEKKRKETEAAEGAKKKAEEEKFALAQAENCKRARVSKAGFDSGVRIARTNANGEREVMDDAARDAELRLVEQVIARDCR